MIRILIMLIMLMLISGNTLAHDGSEDASNLEQWVAGIGIVLIILAGAFSLLWKRPETDTHSEPDDPSLED